MVEIIPAIMPKSPLELEDKALFFSRIERVGWLQIDVMDGVFVPELTWPYNKEEGALKAHVSEGGKLPKLTELSYEIDLMIDNALLDARSWVSYGAKRLVFHVEGVEKGEFEIKTKGLECEIGIALNIETENSVIFPYVEDGLVSFVQCMGISRIGYQGQAFAEEVLEKISQLRVRYPKLIISVDGGVGIGSAPKLIKAGANRLVSGSAILNSVDPKKMIEDLSNE